MAERDTPLHTRVTGQLTGQLAELTRYVKSNLLSLVVMGALIWVVIQNSGQLSEILDELAGANWAWLFAAFAVSWLAAFTGGLAITGGFRDPIPYRSAVLLQIGMWFSALVASSVGSAATIIRFAQKRDLPAPVALTAGVVVSVSGFVVQIAIVIAALAVGRPAMNLDGDYSLSVPGWLVWFVIGLVVVVGVGVAIPRTRRQILDRVSAPIHDVRDNLGSVLRRPANLARMLGGAAGTNLVQALALAAALAAFDQSVPLLTLLAINTLAAFVAGIAPVPGGVGVVEATLYAGLTAAGVPSPAAAASAAGYRFMAAYIPQLMGWFALLILRRRDEL